MPSEARTRPKPPFPDSSWRTQGMYFEAGSYIQDNVGTSSDGGRVSFYALTTSHV
jgi:hypothetical protein